MTGERLAEIFGGIDEELLKREERAYDGGVRKSRIVKWSAVAACVALLLCVTVVLFPRPYDDNGYSDVDIPEWFLGYTGEELDINSLDKLNYYAAKAAVTNDTVNVSASHYIPCSSSSQNEKYYYELNQNEVFTVNKVIGFQIELNNPSNINGFLESRLGSGTVDVVITENSLENMITFKNGDNYFSCLYNGYAKDEIDERVMVRHSFSTHKYIEGFSIVKNLEQVNYEFYIWVDEKTGAVERFECRYSMGASVSAEYLPDAASVVKASGFTSTLNGEFTVVELERYFNKK